MLVLQKMFNQNAIVIQIGTFRFGSVWYHFSDPYYQQLRKTGHGIKNDQKINILM